MHLIRTIAVWSLDLYIAVLWGRLIVDWVRVLARSFQPRGILLFLFVAIIVLTDRPLKAVRKVLPPVRIGALMLDVAWLALSVSCLIVRGILLFIV